MKLSILLPTRNRLDLLRGAIETVRRQDGDWEIVVSDNDSEEDVAGYVSSLCDKRIAVHRTDRFLPVTANWNAALQRSTGDYVLMLGDDDGLLPGYVANLARLVERFAAPDVVYTSALLLTCPGVVAELPHGQLSPYGYASFLAGTHEPFVLDRAVAHEMVRAAMDFRLTYGFNSQFLAISRRLIDELAPAGPFYQSRFPDYYSTNVAFLKARSIVVDPGPRVVIGVSPKSYGFFHVNKREGEGVAFLGGDEEDADADLERVLLPGNNINVGWLSAVETITRRHGAEFGLRANRRRFRLLQAAHVYEERFIHGRIDDEELAALEARLSARERRLFRAAARAASAVGSVTPARLRRAAEYAYRRSLRQFPTWDPPPLAGSYASVVDVFENQPDEPPRAPSRRELYMSRAIIISHLLRRRDSSFVTRYLTGLKGIEIGASSHNNYFLDAINVDRWGARDTPYKQEERMLALHAAKVDVVAPGDALPFDADAVDFVFSSHVLEHFPDPIRALLEWQRVARRYVVAVVPHRDRTFDADRDLTTVDELLERHRAGFRSDEDRHWTVWTCESFLELCDRVGLVVVDHLDPDDKVGNGFAVVIDAAVKPAGV